MTCSYNRTFNISKGKDIGNRESRVRVIMKTVYYIVIKCVALKKIIL